MLVGYNTNVPYRGKLYHVQTEDNGLKKPLVITLLYFKGTILASKKSSYSHLVGDPDYKEKVRELMKEQHKAMMKELIRGVHTGGGADTAEEVRPGKQEEAAVASPEARQPELQSDPKQQISKSLDDILLDYIIRGGK